MLLLRQLEILRMLFDFVDAFGRTGVDFNGTAFCKLIGVCA